MKRAIKNPYHTNHKVYIIIVAVSLTALYTEPYIASSQLSKNIENLSFGCIASAIVAWIIDCANVRIENQKAHNIYDNVYGDLKFNLLFYICTWARICSIAFREEKLESTLNDWFEWYTLTKTHFASSTPERQQSLIPFFMRELEYSINAVNKSIARITDQYYLLTINGVINDELESIIENYKFEFGAIDLNLYLKDGTDQLWSFLDAVNSDIYTYIGDWDDIRHYNYIRHRPRQNFFYDKGEVLRALSKARER